MKTPPHPRFILVALSFAVALQLLHAAQADVQISTEKVEVKQGFDEKELEALQGEWQLVHSDVTFTVHSASADGQVEASMDSDNGIQVKAAMLTRLIDEPLLTLETERQGMPHGVFCLSPQGNKLIGTYDDLVTGRTVDVTLIARKSIRVSVHP